MRSTTLRSWQRHTLWLSLLGHFLFTLGLTSYFILAPHETPQSQAPASISSYLAPSPEAAPAVAEQTPAPTPAPEPTPEPMPQPVEKVAPEPKSADKFGIEKPVAVKSMKAATPAAKPAPSTKPHKPVFASDAVPEDITSPRDQEPLHLVGESKIIKPLIKILARALSQHLSYPRVAADFNLRGVVLVGFVLHPEGYVTEARVVKSSGAGVLDDAARDAVGAMSPVGDVHEYLPASEFMVVGIIFG